MLSLRIFESDDETEGDRETLRRLFESGLKQSELVADARFITEIGRVIAPDWTVSQLEVFAFQRSATPMAGPVLSRNDLGTIDGDTQSPRLPFDWSGVRALTEAGIGTWQAEPLEARVLDGPWHATGYDCSVEVANQRIDIKVEEDALSATKTLGDPCQPDGDLTWSGTFTDGIVTAMLVPGVEPVTPAGETAMEPEPRPIWPDLGIDPNMAYEGNWIIRRFGDSEFTAFASLSKGGRWTCVNNPDGGCWYRLERAADAPWHVRYTKTDNETGGAWITMTGPGSLLAEGDQHGKATLAGGPDVLAGVWAYDEWSGEETWQRVTSTVQTLATPTEPRVEVPLAGPPLTIHSVYSGPGNDMRGNRPGFAIQLLGEHLWGRHNLWMPRESGLEIGDISYICAPKDEGYGLHSDDQVCLKQGGVLGIQLDINVWSEAKPGPQTLYFDDLEIAFNLELAGYPVPPEPPAPREVRFELRSCNVLAELDPPEEGEGLIFTRSAPVP